MLPLGGNSVVWFTVMLDFSRIWAENLYAALVVEITWQTVLHGVVPRRIYEWSLRFPSFQVELGPDIQTFAQLLHRKDEVIALLQKHLAVEDSLALQPLLS